MLSVETNETKKGLGIHARRALAYIVLVIMSFLCLFWFYILFVNATRSKGELTQGFTLLPSTHLIQNWKGVMAGPLPVVRGMINSLVVATCSAVLCTYFSTMTAYAIHVYDFKLKKFMFTFILAIMTIPTQVTALGFIQLVADMKLEDNFIPLIIPAIAAPATFFYMKQYMESALPLSLVEAARIDGSGEFRTFNSIVLPLMKPAIAVQAIFAFVQNWNNFYTQNMIIISNEKRFTMPIMIQSVLGQDKHPDLGAQYAAVALSVIPIIVIYLILSRFIVAGVALGGVKE